MVVNALARAACAALGSLSFLGIFSTCVLPYWKMSSWQTSSALYGRMPTYDGVWWQCMTLKAGGFTCSNYGKPSIFLSAMVHLVLILITAIPDWKHSAWQASDPLIGRLANFAGIWWRCFSPKWGIFLCDNYGKVAIYSSSDIQAMRAMMCIASIASFFAVLCSLLSLDCSSLLETNSKPKNVVAFVAGVLYAIAATLQAQRALMIVAVLTSLFGTVIGMISLRCTTAVKNDVKAKSYIGVASAVLFILSGVMCGAAVSWYAWRVTYEYFSPFYQEKEFKYEFGSCLYMGWVSTALGICTLVSTIWFAVNVQQQFYDPMYKNSNFKYEFGSCLYIGWVCGAITLISGLILICGSCKRDKDDEDKISYPYSYQPSKVIKETKTEYV